MQENELAYLSMTELSSLIQKKLSVTELVRFYLKRIERLNPVLNAYITVCGDEALTEAKIIDDSLAKGKKMRDPLLGMPISLKDQFDTGGVLSTYGLLAFKDHIPKEDSTVVSRLKGAGAIILGKLNMSPESFGRARNPWNTNHTASGSSSGTGIAVSAGLCAAGIGEDTAGSGRNPASVCGVVGYRPSHGLVSRYGLHAFVPSTDTGSPCGRTVEDTAVLLRAIAGWDPKDPLSSRRPVPDYVAALKGGIKGIRIGVIQELVDNPGVNPEVKAATQAAIAMMAELGAIVDEVSIPQVDASIFALFAMYMAEQAAIHKNMLDTRLELLEQSTRLNLLTGAILPTKGYTRALQAQALIRAQTLAALGRCDVLVCPMNPKLPATIEAAVKGAIATTKEDVVTKYGTLTGYGGFGSFAALAGCPAISVPSGFSKSDLPIGLQIIGRPFDDATVLRVAHIYEQNTEWHKRHPNA